MAMIRRTAGGFGLVVSLAASLVLGGCADSDPSAAVSSAADQAVEALGESADDQNATSASITAALEDAELATLASAVAEVDLVEVAGSDQFTLFAPTDDAFLTLTADRLANLNDDVDLLTEMLRAHIVDRAIPADELTTMQQVSTVAGTTLPIGEEDGVVTVGGANVVDSDIEAGAGIVHTVDQLLATE